MKHPILCLFMILSFTVSVIPESEPLSAAEIWNTNRVGGKKSEGSYYNKKNYGKNGSSVIYNKRHKGDNRFRLPIVSRSVRNYKKMRISREIKASKLWKTMSPAAIRNRQADINLALQREYNLRIKLRNSMKIAARIREKSRKYAHIEHLKRVEEYKERKRARERIEWEKKQRFLDYGHDLIRKKKRVYKVRTYKNDGIGLKKPKRLFNDPND